MERRRASGYSGTTGESNRRLSGKDYRISEDAAEIGGGVSTEDINSGLTHTADEVRKLIYDLGTKERIAEEKREDSTVRLDIQYKSVQVIRDIMFLCICSILRNSRYY